MSENKEPEEKQNNLSKGWLTAVFVGAAVNTFMLYGAYNDYLIDAKRMREDAPYDVQILSSRDGKNKKGDNMTAYLLSKDFMLYASTCTKDRAELVTGVKIRVTGEFTAYDSFTFPEEYKQEQAKRDYWLHMSMENNFHLIDIVDFYRGITLDQLDKSSIKYIDINETMTAIVQDKDEKYNTKTEVLDVKFVANKEDNGTSSNCIRQYYYKPLVP